MIRYFARLAPIVVGARLRSDGSLVGRLDQRVHLSEIDANLHVNQAVYPKLFELARADWLVRSRAWMRWRKAGLNPMVAEQTVTYRRELKPFARFTIDTRALRIDGRFLHLESHLFIGERVHTKADVKLLFVGPDGVADAETVAQQCAWCLTEPLAVENWALAPPASSHTRSR